MATVTKSVDAADDGGEPLPKAPPVSEAGTYVIVSPIAAGGGGSVWLARDTRVNALRRNVAVKFLHSEGGQDAAHRRRFLREAEIASTIVHPNVVEVIDVGEAAGHPYLVMPFIKGTTVRELLRKGALPLEVIVTIMADALAGLGAAHEARTREGIPLALVHRDISPHNLLVGVDGNTKLTDFGIARPTQDAGLSTTRWAQGKVSYFSPEQGRGEPLDQRSDLFAMGIVLWECLTGRSLFRADDPFVTAHRVQTMRAPRPSSLRHDVPPEIDEVVERALSPKREGRFDSAAKMAEALVAAAALSGVEVSRTAVATLATRVAAEEAERTKNRPPPPTLAAVPAATSVGALESTARDPAPEIPEVSEPRRKSRFGLMLGAGGLMVAAIAVFAIYARAKLQPPESTSTANASAVSSAGSVAIAPSPTGVPSAATSVLQEVANPESSAAPPVMPSPSGTARRRPSHPPVRPPTNNGPKLPSPSNPFAPK